MSKFQLHMAFMLGWGDGAGTRSVRPREAFKTDNLYDYYGQGYIAGQAARHATSLESSDKIGVRINAIRLMESSQSLAQSETHQPAVPSSVEPSA